MNTTQFEILPKPIFFVGLSHVGKSFLSRKLASKLECEAIDLDKKIEQNAGIDIATIFDFEKEDGFRNRETLVLRSIDVNQLSVVATGSGIILREENVEFMRQNGFIIYLVADFQVLLSRILKKSDRPLFRNRDPEDVLLEMQTIRTPLYEKCAHQKIFLKGDNWREFVHSCLVSVQNSHSKTHES